MVLQSASRKEVRRIAIGSSVCAAIQIAAFFLLSLVGIGTFSYKIIIGTVGGTCMGILNFALMCIMIQRGQVQRAEGQHLPHDPGHHLSPDLAAVR